MKQRTCGLLLVLLASCLPAGAAEDKAVDARLDQEVNITEKGDRLGAVLERLTKKTGVKFYAHVPMRETMVVVRYEGALRDLMDALTHFVAIDKDNLGYWIDEGGGRYTLARQHAGERAAQNLRREREATLQRGMDQAIRDNNRWVKHLGALTDQERLAIYSGQQMAYHSDHFGGKRFLEEVLLRDAVNWSEKVQVTYGMTGHSPLTRMFVRQFTDLEGPNTSEERFAVSQLCPQLAPERQQQEWRQRYGDPAPRDTRQVKVLDTPLASREIARRELLLRIAEKADVNLIADDYGQTMDESRQPSRGSVAELLDAVCQFQFGGGETPDTNHGSFWRKCGEVYIVRSLAWPEEEAQPRL